MFLLLQRAPVRSLRFPSEKRYSSQLPESSKLTFSCFFFCFRVASLQIPFAVTPAVLHSLLSRQYTTLSLFQITEQHIAALKQCSRLQSLTMTASGPFSPAVIREMLQSLPNLCVFHITQPNGQVVQPLNDVARPKQQNAPPLVAPAPAPAKPQ